MSHEERKTELNEKTVVPLGMVIAGFGIGLGPLIAGVIWVYSVNLRLDRIEAKLGIPPLASSSLIREANAKGK